MREAFFGGRNNAVCHHEADELQGEKIKYVVVEVPGVLLSELQKAVEEGHRVREVWHFS